MSKEEILSKVKEAFISVLEHDNFQLADETTADDVDGWESVTHMMIISEVEKSFGIKFKLMDLMNMNNVGDLIRTIESEL
ncbi:acyl carrier protein [Aquimarina sp. EL_43]|uniref:Acyl carrier protein n=1 Tax=Aquimarina atlantica TaxID=1317122 RepID=A0A023BZB2_9FLAO|nr:MULTISPECIES: acyl carrier protein [Aquimarina]EZH75330.1 acyl carrier protein [Aquimarina atlantica]MBG6129912.1 acyl carrier protein [Aquimarina sp. EL_35]MBG6150977.1 acyl carrier protein [Aquimarina sp. EL_32]MBG6167716.1 acyl carrier protein [Aquimarina sp. EL_43]